uniref:Uncharacterized protein n=1 Tax=Chromera velia CCMP2878 TaxID=1169474 RepID=A0A0G4FAC1_9ALVE|eukprot:Cvel_16009.t1-p1 / transcript=Cvel_16009.t1 / gene=Cvel_16009 / organism=Chromera_velia_CCMP2878 / gene_product=hypothetical protein / transcript_product=hypothetical protein / location=Cvel_scaffold1214:24564-26164(-) / protein_length=158 / sequence_SO=supercontig / SO=protein_coding / is_pseudo=false
MESIEMYEEARRGMAGGTWEDIFDEEGPPENGGRKGAPPQAQRAGGESEGGGGGGREPPPTPKMEEGKAPPLGIEGRGGRREEGEEGRRVSRREGSLTPGRCRVEASPHLSCGQRPPPLGSPRDEFLGLFIFFLEEAGFAGKAQTKGGCLLHSVANRF